MFNPLSKIIALVVCVLIVALMLSSAVNINSLKYNDMNNELNTSNGVPSNLMVNHNDALIAPAIDPGGPVVPHPPGTIVIVPVYNAYVSHTTTSSITNNSVYFPPGRYAKITVTYFNQYISNPFDTSFVVTVGDVQILAGNTLENENTSVTENVTQYYSILQGHATVTVGTPQFNPGYSSRLSVWFTFYIGSETPHPSEIIPAFTDINFQTPANAFPNNVPIPFNVTHTASVTLPNNITSAYLNLYEQQNGNDEFWYTLQPPFREFRIYIDGMLVGTVQPYPNVQTGGGDLFLWQPILAIGAELYPPHVIPLTPYLSLLKGKVQVSVEVIHDESLWIRSALNFMVNTSSMGSGTILQNSFSFNDNYTQSPPTNLTTESIPYSAPFLNDTENVTEHLSSAGIFDYGSSSVYSMQSQNVTFFANATEFDPSFNIVGETPVGIGLVSYENFYLAEYINQTYMTYYKDGSTAIKTMMIVDSYYQINGTSVTDIAFSPLQVVIGFNVTQIRSIHTVVVESIISTAGLTTSISYNYSETEVNGTGLFIGQLNSESELTSLSYNHAFTQKAVFYASGGFDKPRSTYLLLERAVNNSLVNRNGDLVFYLVVKS
ncbi:MAG: peptide-N4-asparagine amidase [Methanomassiliicoccales archaeon]